MPLKLEGFDNSTHIDDQQAGSYRTEVVRRIAEAYRKAKETQLTVSEPYKVGYMWQAILDNNFRSLIRALENNDLHALISMLGNFQRERFADGAGSSSGDHEGLSSNFMYRYDYINTWLKYYNRYAEISEGKPILGYPDLGGVAGVRHQGAIIPTEAIRYHYIAREIVDLLSDVPRPVVCEIGGGLGGQAFSVLNLANQPVTYIDLDIPEMLVIASYFLLMAFPEKKALLYGEKDWSNPASQGYEIILAPNFVLPKIDNMTVDLFFNSNSLSEMNRATATEYVKEMERVCRRYIMHINHTGRFKWAGADGVLDNMVSTEIRPNRTFFKKIYQHPRIFGKLGDEIFYFKRKAEHFHFLYERKRYS